MLKSALQPRTPKRIMAIVLALALMAPTVATAGAEAYLQTDTDHYRYIDENFNLGGDGTTLASGIAWVGTHTVENGELLLKSARNAAKVDNFNAAYPDEFVLEFRAKTSAVAADGDWAIQMQVTPDTRLMLKSYANGEMKSCTAGGTWANTITGTPNDTQWHSYRLELSKTAKTAMLYIDSSLIATITLQTGGANNPMLNFFKDSSTATIGYIDDVRLLFPVDAGGAPIWTPAQNLHQTAATHDSITVTWDSAIGVVTQYLLYKGEDAAIEVAGDQNSHTFSTLRGSTGYPVRVEAKNNNGVTTTGPTVEARTKYNPADNGVDIAPFWTGGVGGYGAYRIPGIVVTSQDTIIAYCEARRGGGDWDPMDLVIRRSEDGGDTWSENHVLIPGLERGITVNNPVIIVDNDKTTLHMLYCVMYGVAGLNGSVYYMKSTDDGKTWSEPSDIGSSCYPEGDTAFTDRNVIATGPGHGIQLKNGTLIVPIWMTDGPRSDSKGHQPSVVSTLYSKDMGATWKVGEIIHRNQGGMALSNPNETTVVELSDGKVMLNIRRQWGSTAANPNYRVVTVSDNGYSGWSQPRADTQLMDAGNGCFGSLVRYDAKTILFTNAEDLTDRRNVTVKASFDDGVTWSAKKSLDPRKLGSTYSDIAVDSHGVIYDLHEVGSGMKLARFNLAYLTKPFAPTGVTAEEIMATTADISWGRSPDNLGTATYNLYLGESETPVNATPITQTGYSLTGLTANTQYTVRVVELCQAGSPNANNHSDPATVTLTTADQTPPEPIVLFDEQFSSDTQNSFNWSANPRWTLYGLGMGISENSLSLDSSRYKEMSDLGNRPGRPAPGALNDSAVFLSGLTLPSKITVEFKAKVSQYITNNVPGDYNSMAFKLVFDNNKCFMLSIEEDGIYCFAGNATWQKVSETAPGGDWNTFKISMNKTSGAVTLQMGENVLGSGLTLQNVPTPPTGPAREPVTTPATVQLWSRGKNPDAPARAQVDYFTITATGPTLAAIPVWPMDKTLSQSQATTSSVEIGWPAAYGSVTNYVIYNGADLVATVASTVTSYTIDGLTPGTTLQLRVDATNTAGAARGPSGEAKTKYEVGSIIKDDQLMFATGVGGYSDYRIPGIVVTSENTVLAYCEARDCVSDWAPMDLLAVRSLDNGETWAPTQVIVPGIRDGLVVNNPVMVVDGNKIHLLYCLEYGVAARGGKVCYSYSEDDGITWSAPVDISSVAIPTEFERNVIATGPGHGLVSSMGVVIIPVWMTNASPSTSTSHSNSRVGTLYSTDHGATWQMGEAVPVTSGTSTSDPASPNETSISETSDGRIMLNMRNTSGNKRRLLTYSETGYGGWSKPVYQNDLLDPTCYGGSVNYDKNTLLFVNDFVTNTPRRESTVSVSFDDGASWPIHKMVYPGVGDYPDVAVDGQKTIYHLYETQTGGTGYGMRLARYSMGWVMEGVNSSRLLGITPSLGAMTPAFSVDTFDYEVKLAEADTALNLVFKTFAQDVSITVNDVPLEGRTYHIPVIESNITRLVVQTTHNGTTSTYNLKISKAMAVPENAMVAYYSFEKTIGGQIPDMANMGNDLTIYNGTDGVGPVIDAEGHPGKSVSISAASVTADAGRLALATGNGTNFGTGNFTVSVWFKTPNITTEKFVAWYGSTGGKQWWIRVSAGKLAFLVGWGEGNEALIEAPLAQAAANTWQHGLFVRRGTKMELYLNGAKVTEHSIPGDADVSGDPMLTVGRSTNSAKWRGWDGKLDELRLYNYALSADEIQKVYTIDPEKTPCTCTLAGLTFADGELDLGEEGVLLPKALMAAVTYNDNCAIPGHKKPAEFAYVLAPAGVNTAEATIAGNVLTATKTGAVEVQVTATVNSSSLTQKATFTAPEATYHISVSTVSGGAITSSKATAIAGDEITLTVSPESGYRLKENTLVVFKTGALESTGNVVEHEFTMPAYAVTVTAEFERIPTYTVTFDANGGEDLDVATLEVTYGALYGTLPTPTTTAEDKIFDGWFTAAEAGTNVTETTTVTEAGSHTLYAHWRDAAVSAAPDTSVSGMPAKVMLPYVGEGILLSAKTLDTYTYQWQRKTDGDWASLEGETRASYTAPAQDILFINSGWKYRCTITNTEVGKTAVTAEGAAVMLTVAKGRKAAPSGLRGVAPAAVAGEDGKVVGLGSDKLYEYKRNGTSGYTAVAANSSEIMGLTADTYQVRFAVTADYLASPDATVVVPAPAPGVVVTGVTLNPTSVTLEAGSVATLAATVAPNNATNRNVRWGSDAAAVATVENGVITAVGAGTATITVTTEDGNKTATCVVTVTAYVPPYNPPSTTTETTTGEDGSTIKTVTNKKTGTVTETIVTPDGDKTVAETKKDGTVTQTVIRKDGSHSETVTNPDGAFTSKVTDASGTKVETIATAAGETTAKVTLPKDTKSTKVTIPMKKPAAGTVAVLVHGDGTEEIIKTSVIKGDGVRFTANGNVEVKLVDNSKKFGDVEENHWAADAVQFVASRELFTGVGKGDFAPMADMSRAMLITVLARLDSQDTTAGETWYSAAVKWGRAAGITDGENLEATISREQLALMLYRYAKAENTEADFSKFSDADSVSSWSAKAMSWAVHFDIITGKDGKLNPQGTATRAEVATMLQRFASI